ncbi:MAG: YczE/YyaS/YitT family protein [Eggerthellaceae bacterium]|jgi:uncharacterized membrane protein YczE
MEKTYNMSLRILIYIVGVCMLALGVVVNTRCGMGASTVNCIVFVFSENSVLTLGQATMCIYVADLLIQILVFKGMSLRIALQIPFSFVFGFLVDFFDAAVAGGFLSFFQNPDLGMGIFMLVFGILCTGIGVSMVMNMNFVPNPPDGCTQAVGKLTGLPFGRAKWLNDAIRLAIAAVSGIVLAGHIQGIGIGTVICMFTIGNICQFVDDHMAERYHRIYNPQVSGSPAAA